MLKRGKEDFRKYYEIIGDPIGIGGFGKVYKVKEKETNEERAIKIIDKNEIKENYFNTYLYKMNEEDMKPYITKFENEIKYMKILEGKNKENKNTVKFYEYFHTEKEFVIVMELCDGNLTKLFENKRKDEGLNIDEIYNILNQLNNSFKIMYKNKIVHRDLKLENILLKYENEDKYIVKLSDYGESKNLLNVYGLSTRIGTPKLMAPEILEGNKNYNEKCDLWSLGTIIYRLYFSKYPYDNETEFGVINLLKNGQKLLKKSENEELNDLIRKLLKKDPKERISWENYFNHSFFNNRINYINVKYNEITMIIRIGKADINKAIYFLDNTDGYYSINGKLVFHKHDNLKELNESNIILFINNKKYNYKKYLNSRKKVYMR